MYLNASIGDPEEPKDHGSAEQLNGPGMRIEEEKK
jgi:hypothetical protein